MYDSCLICHADLGTNQVITAFPVGRRIAFDPAEGRIWVLCQSCHEWNLAPIEERWDAIEQCETAFAKAVYRLSADDNAVAAIDGTELIRIGTRDADGLATWRYTDRLEARRVAKLARRRFRYMARNIAVALGLLAPPVVLGLPAMGLSVAALAVIFPVIAARRQFRARGIIARVEVREGRWIDITRHRLANIRLVPDPGGTWALRIGHDLLSGVHAIRAVRLLLPHVNWRLSQPDVVKSALDYILSRGRSLERVFKAASRRRGVGHTARLAKLDPHIRLALEMLANEETEREAIRSELRYLHGEWKQAQELARIQDDLLLPESVEQQFEILRLKASRPGRHEDEGDR